MNIPEIIIKRLCENGFDAYICGGSVRDMFLDRDHSDIDIVTNALPVQLSKIFTDMKVDMVGASFLVTLIEDIEVATYRTDRNHIPGRQNCIAESCTSLHDDLLRRDFTFNAMVLCPFSGDVIDRFNGRADLRNKVVNFVGDPISRIHEDPLRMLRAARFACLIEGDLHVDTFTAIASERKIIKNVSFERIRSELIKVMGYRKPSIFFDVLHSVGILDILFPDIEKLYSHPGGKYHSETLDKHCMLVGDHLSPKKPLLRLAGYLHDIGKVEAFRINNGESFIGHAKIGAELAQKILERYKFSTMEVQTISNLVRFHMKSLNYALPKTVRRLIQKFVDNNVDWRNFVRLRLADRAGNLSKVPYTPKEINNLVMKVHEARKLNPSGGFKITDLTVNGRDVMEILHIGPGKAVGEVLRVLLDLVVDDPDKNNRETLLNLIREINEIKERYDNV